MSQNITTLIQAWRDMGLVSWAGHKYGWILEDNSPITLTDWQHAILAEYWQRRNDVTTLFVSTVKKTGKTTISSLVVAYRWLTIQSVHFVVANDQSQAEELQFNIIASMVKRHPILRRFTKITKDTITFEPTESRIVSLPMDAPGSAGANFATVSFSELWGYRYEEGQRLYEELTPIPGDCLRVIDSYAGYEGESELLKRVWERGGESVNDDWPITLAGQQLSYIHQGEDAQLMCWRGTEAERVAYYQEQEETLRPGTYRRLHLNEWSSNEDAFITPEQWDSLIDSDYRPSLEDADLFIAVDAGIKHDNAACVSVYRGEDDRLYLGPYRIWKPSPQIELQAIEDHLLELYNKYSIADIVCDPYQLMHLIQRLSSAGLPISEYPQTVGNLTEAGNILFDLIRQKRLVIYSGCDDLRKHILNARAKETERGIRLVKEKSSKKIDAAIALAMACHQAEEEGADEPYSDVVRIRLR